MSATARNVAIVGAASLVGLHLIELLQSSKPAWHISVLDNFRSGNEALVRQIVDPDRGTVRWLDVRDREDCLAALTGHQVVFHLAAMLSMSFSAHTREALETNVLGSLNVIEAAEQAGARLVLSSSCGGVYGLAPAGVVHADTPFFHAGLATGTAMYGAGKIIAESICRDRASSDRDFEWLALRYSSVYGRYQHDRGRNTTQLTENVERLTSGRPAILSRPPDEAHDYVEVKDVARANLLAALAPAAALGRPYNVASGVSTTNEQLAQCLHQLAGMHTEPDWQLDADAPPARPLVTIDVEPAAALLKFRAEVDLRTGMGELYRSSLQGRVLSR